MYDVNESIEYLEYLLEGEFELRYSLKDLSIRYENDFSSRIYNESFFYHEYEISIYASSDDIIEEVGELTFKLFNTSLMDFLNQNRFDVFDSISSECNELVNVLQYCDKINDEYKDANCVVYLERLFINKSIRNKGIAHRVLNQIYDIIDWYLETTPKIVILQSYPIEIQMEFDRKDKDSKEYISKINQETVKLNKLYSDCGFNSIKNHDSYYFYKLSNN